MEQSVGAGEGKVGHSDVTVGDKYHGNKIRMPVECVQYAVRCVY